MTRWVFSLGLVLGMGSLTSRADDPKPEPRPTASTPPDFSAYTTVGDAVGEIVKADDKKITLRITWYVAQGSSGGRPRLNGNKGNFRNPLQMSRGRGRGRGPQVKEMHHDYDLEYVPESLVRFKTLPNKTDIDGKRTSYTSKELDALKQPFGAPGYTATKADLTPGTVVEVHVLRDKTIPAAKVTEDDIRLKYVIILGHVSNPSKDGGSPKKDEKK